MIKYFPIENYSMKCRLYPNKEQAEYIDCCLRGIKALSNMLVYDIRNEFKWTTEGTDKKTGEVIHWVDYNKAFSKKSLDHYRERNKYIDYLRSESLSSKVFGLCHDFKQSAETPSKSPVEKWGSSYYDKKTGNKKTMGVKFYKRSMYPKSFSYKATINSLSLYDNNKVIGIKLGNRKYKPDGYAKIRGWNQNIRFDEEHQVDFRDWINRKCADSVRVRICKDTCGDYYIVFLFKLVYKPMNVPDKKAKSVGIDVGEITLATLSDGTEIENFNDHYTDNKITKERNTLRYYNRRLSRSEGWKNIKFRKKYRDDKTLTPSKTYVRYDAKYKKLSRRIQRQRNHYYNEVTAKIATSYDVVGIESLKVKDMQFKKRKSKNDSKGKDKQADTRT